MAKPQLRNFPSVEQNPSQPGEFFIAKQMPAFVDFLFRLLCPVFEIQQARSAIGEESSASVLNHTFQSCTVKMILPLKVALCLGFNLPEVSENNQTKLLEKSTKCPLKSTPSTFGCNPYVAEV